MRAACASCWVIMCSLNKGYDLTIQRRRHHCLDLAGVLSVLEKRYVEFISESSSKLFKLFQGSFSTNGCNFELINHHYYSASWHCVLIFVVYATQTILNRFVFHCFSKHVENLLQSFTYLSDKKNCRGKFFIFSYSMCFIITTLVLSKAKSC